MNEKNYSQDPYLVMKTFIDERAMMIHRSGGNPHSDEQQKILDLELGSKVSKQCEFGFTFSVTFLI